MTKEREEAKRQDSMIVNCLREEDLSRRDIHEAVMTRGSYYLGIVEESEDKNANMALDVPIEEDYEQELAETWDDIEGQEFEPDILRKASALDTERYEKMNVFEKRSTEEYSEETNKPLSKVKWVDRSKGDTTHECEVEAGGKTNQHRHGTRIFRSGFADATVSNGHWNRAQGF